uniref:Dynamin N-terminal domain-containing protein n=1 Tax=Magallana gigas TaxID=29159 RepID=A0A8W8P2U5_MAGGI
MASAVTDQNLQENNAGVDDLHSCSDFLYTNGYCAIQNDLKELYSSLQGFVVKEEFKMHIQRDAFNIDNIEEKLEQLKVDVMRTECPIVIAGETSSGKSSIINLILGEQILPTGIGASTSKVCRVKHSDCYEVSTKDRNGKILEEARSFKNAKEMTEKLQDLAEKADEEISYVDIYMPVPMLQGNVMIVDTPGFGDQEQQGVAEKMMSYLPNALAFIFVLNVSNAGGVQDDRV